jgi:hypothetical protein
MDDKKQLTPLTGGLKLQDQLLGELEKSAKSMGQDFTEYGKKCVINAIAKLVIDTKQQGYGLDSFDPTLVRLALQNIGYTELNIAAIPSECYLDIRNTEDGKKSLAIKPQGAGNEKLLRTYGVNVKEVRPCWLVREGDEFTYPSYDGLNMTPPKWTPKSFDKKVVMVVYPVIKTDNTVEYLIATREGIKPNIIAQIRQNSMYAFTKEIEATGKNGNKYTKEVTDKEKRNEFYEKVEEKANKMSVDDLINDVELAKYINPTYTSGGSKEQMILRKMCNNALKYYPKEYKDSYMASAIEDMFEDKDDSLKAPREYIDADTVEKVEEEIKEEPKGAKVNDFDADSDGVIEEEVKVETKPDPTTAPKKVEDYGF